MIVSDEGQAKVFGIYILFGMLCILIADLFYVIKRRFGVTRAATGLDILYYTLTFLLILYAGLRFNFGALRYYQIFALLIGMVVHKLLFSQIARRVLEFLLVFFLKVICIIVKGIWKAAAFVLAGFFSITGYIEEKTIRGCHRVKKYAEKVKVKRKKKNKTVKKRLKMI